MAGTTGLEPAASTVTALREWVLQQLRTTRGPPNIAQVVQNAMNCGLESAFPCHRGDRPFCPNLDFFRSGWLHSGLPEPLAIGGQFSLAGSFWGRTKVDLDCLYLISFDSEEFCVPGAAAILGFAVVQDEGFVAFFNGIGRGLFAIGSAPFEISFTVNAIVVRTGKYELVAQ